MKHFYKSILIFFVVLSACLGPSGSAAAQNSRPLDDVLEDWQGYSWSDIVDIASWEAENDGPLYPSAPSTTPSYETFEGSFSPEDENTKLAIFSDDGCDVYINGVRVHQAKDRGQALPNLSQSLHRITYAFQAGQTYQIRVEYSNTIYQGDADVDGASLFAYTTTGGPSLQLSSDRSAVVAGGWDESIAEDRDDLHQGHAYLQTETGRTVNRGTKPDPHIATLTATLTDGDGEPMARKTVTFSWDMPGPAPQETRTATTDSNGRATVDVISGDELSKADANDDSPPFDRPVTVQAAFMDVQATQMLNVVSAQAQWQYKNDSGNYVEWDGTIYDDYNDENVESKDMYLKVVLTHDGLPVIGHPVRWGIESITDKDGEPIDSGVFSQYGHLSGSISTTTSRGSATASFAFGELRFGSITLSMEDDSAYTDSTSDVLNISRTSRMSNPRIVLNAPRYQTLALINPGSRVSKQKLKFLKTSGIKTVYTWVDGFRDYPNFDITQQWRHNPSNSKHPYPAPPSEENYEMLKETREDIISALSDAGFRYGVDYWFAQGIGADPASGGTHLVDGFYTSTIPNATKHPYCAAVDIVLNRPVAGYSGVGVRGIYKDMSGGTLKQARESAFRPMVQALRQKGFAAWHRWVRLTGSYYENEIHLIDPIVPSAYVKQSLITQMTAYVSKSGGMISNEANEKDQTFLATTDAHIQQFYVRRSTSSYLLNRYTFEGP